MNTAGTISNSDAAFYRDRKAMLVYPLIIIPFTTALFFVLGGGKGNRYVAEDALAGKPGSGGFNATMPSAENSKINGRNIDAPGYGKAKAGQVLSSFTHTRADSSTSGLKAISVNNKASSVSHASSLAANTSATSAPLPTATTAKSSYVKPKVRKYESKANGGYYYKGPGYANSGSDQQVASQLRTYESTRYATAAAPVNANQPVVEPNYANGSGEGGRPATVQVSDNLTATRLVEPINADAFNTAPTLGSRRQAERAVVSGGNSYGSKKTVAWMIPVVVHEDQVFKSGNTVKLRLTKEISADGITIPANTILHAVCQTSEDRLRMVVRSLQLNDQLIPLDLEVYDIDGIAGVNMPGLSNNTSGQLQSSAIQGIQVPGVGGLVNTVANQARMSASNSARQPTVRLKAGYNLYLKAS